MLSKMKNNYGNLSLICEYFNILNNFPQILNDVDLIVACGIKLNNYRFLELQDITTRYKFKFEFLNSLLVTIGKKSKIISQIITVYFE